MLPPVVLHSHLMIQHKRTTHTYQTSNTSHERLKAQHSLGVLRQDETLQQVVSSWLKVHDPSGFQNLS